MYTKVNLTTFTNYTSPPLITTVSPCQVTLLWLSIYGYPCIHHGSTLSGDPRVSTNDKVTMVIHVSTMDHHSPGDPLVRVSVDDKVTMVIHVSTMEHHCPDDPLVRVSVDDKVTMVIHVSTMDHHCLGDPLVRISTDDKVTMVIHVSTMDHHTPLSEYPRMTKLLWLSMYPPWITIV